ncbi:MAG: alpha/beta hydrolase fold domain-containing protein [Gaiellaceae bacterium]
MVDGDFTKPAFSEHAAAKPLNTPMMEWFGKHYAPDKADPHFAVSQADLTGLPTTTIVNAEVDPLRDDGKLLADKLSAAGIDVKHRKFDGVTHEFFGMGAVVDKANEAVDFAAGRLVASFEQARSRTV